MFCKPYLPSPVITNLPLFTRFYKKRYSNIINFSSFCVCYSVDAEFVKLKLGDLSIISTLGVGGFGRVELVGTVHQFNS